MIGMIFIGALVYVFYVEVVTVFENHRDEKRIQEYFKNRS
jgi:hypothetical protein